MFYDKDLLSIKKKGKLARCWLAATLSERMFKNTVKQTTLQSMKIAELCEEILRTVYGSNRTRRASLYFSSQLLYGTTKILLYQTKLLQDDIFTIRLQEERISPKRKFDSAFALEEPEIPLFEIFNDRTAGPDLNLIMDEPLVFEHMVQDELNFGALPDYEMENFLSIQTEEQLLNEIRAFNCNQTQEIIEETVQVPSIDLNNLDVETIQIRKEPLSINNRDEPIEKPVKHTKETTKSLLETSKKRRKISTEEIRCSQTPSFVDVPLLAYAEPLSIQEEPIVSESVAEPAEVSVQGPVVPTKVPNRQVHITETQRRGIKFVDKKTTLSGIEMQRWIKDVHAHTKSRRFICNTIYNKHFHSLAYYFQQHCSKISHGGLGKQLVKLFSQHMITQPVTDNEFIDIDIDSSLPTLRHDGTVQAEAPSEVHERIFDISSNIAVPSTEINNNLTTAETNPLLEDILLEMPETQIETSRKEIDETLPALPEIAEFEENIGPKVCSSAVYHKLQSITETEVGKLLQDHWDEGTFIKFHEIISPDTNTNFDAARVFQCLLDFHAQKRVILKQAKPFDTIWIEKPMESSEESEEINVETL